MRQIKSEQKKTSSQKYSRTNDFEMENQNYFFKKIKLNNKTRVRKKRENEGPISNMEIRNDVRNHQF